jgi:hypothetical protein
VHRESLHFGIVLEGAPGNVHLIRYRYKFQHPEYCTSIFFVLFFLYHEIRVDALISTTTYLSISPKTQVSSTSSTS